MTRIAEASHRIETLLAALQQAVRARETRYPGQSTLQQALDVLPGQDLEVLCHGDQPALPMAAEGLALVLGHLLDNAQAHGATRVDLTLRSQEGGLSLRVQDNGPGISEGNPGQGV